MRLLAEGCNWEENQCAQCRKLSDENELLKREVEVLEQQTLAALAETGRLRRLLNDK